VSVRVMSWVLEHSPVTHRGDLLVQIVLADHAHDDGTSAYPSVDTLAKRARLSRRGVFDALARLKDADMIVADGHGPRGVVAYRLVMSDPPVQPLHGATAAPVQSAAPGGAVTSAEGVQGTAPKPSLEPSGEPPASLALARGGGTALDDDELYVSTLFAELAAAGVVRAAGDVRRAVVTARDQGLDGDELRAFADRFAESLKATDEIGVAASVFAHRVSAGDHRTIVAKPASPHRSPLIDLMTDKPEPAHRNPKPWAGALGRMLEEQRQQQIVSEVMALIPDVAAAFGEDGVASLASHIVEAERDLRRNGDASPDDVAVAVTRRWRHLLPHADEAAA
jgi:hypothetical protein